MWTRRQRLGWCPYNPRNPKDGQQPPEPGRGEEQTVRESLQGEPALPPPRFQTSPRMLSEATRSGIRFWQP